MNEQTEAQAKELGWTPKEEWVENGNDPDKWRDAQAFIDYGERNAKFVRKALEKEMAEKLEQATKAFDERVAKLENVTSTALKAAQDKAETERKALIKRWQSHKTKAAEEENLVEYNKADIALRALEGQAPQAVENGPSPESTAFHGKYMPLINQSTEVQQFTDDAALAIRRDNPAITEAEYFRELSSRIEDRFGDDYPQFFGRTGKKPPPVDTSDGDAGESPGNTFADLPPEAKKICNDFVKDGILTKEQYVASYFGE